MRHAPGTTARTVLLGASIALLCTGNPASAACAGMEAIDACLVGAWRQTGGGAVEWMRRNMQKGMTIPNTDQGDRVIVFNGDGGYRSAPASGKITMRMESAEGGLRADSDLKVQARGRWSAKSGMLHLCTDHQTFEGRARITTPGGPQQVMPLPAPQASGPTSFGYRCSKRALETRKSFPGIPNPMVTHYERAEMAASRR